MRGEIGTPGVSEKMHDSHAGSKARGPRSGWPINNPLGADYKKVCRSWLPHALPRIGKFWQLTQSTDSDFLRARSRLRSSVGHLLTFPWRPQSARRRPAKPRFHRHLCSWRPARQSPMLPPSCHGDDCLCRRLRRSRRRRRCDCRLRLRHHCHHRRRRRHDVLHYCHLF